MHNENDEQKPTDTIPPITNTGAGTVTPWYETGTSAPLPQDAAAAPEQEQAPEWWQIEGTHAESALPLAQHEWMDRAMRLAKGASATLEELGDLLGGIDTGHLLPIPEQLVNSFNSRGPLATDDPRQRRYATHFGVTARLYTKVSLAIDLLGQAARELADLGNVTAQEARKARGDTMPSAPPQEGGMPQALADLIAGLRAQGATVEVVGGSSLGTDAELDILREAIGATAVSESAA